MKIIQALEDAYYKEQSRLLGNCYNVIENDITYHYEFLITDLKAEIRCDSSLYLEEVVEEYHFKHPYIYEYFTKDHNFFMTYDKIHIFKLPISILQVSSVFLDQKRLDDLKEYIDLDSLFFPVQIIDDEYVVLDKLHELYLTSLESYRMVNVYMSEETSLSKDYLYLTKEQNIRTIKDMHIISHEEYEEILKQLSFILNLV